MPLTLNMCGDAYVQEVRREHFLGLPFEALSKFSQAAIPVAASDQKQSGAEAPEARGQIAASVHRAAIRVWVPAGTIAASGRYWW